MDLPGDDSIHAYHSQIVYNYLPNADVVLFLSSATKPIAVPELKLLSKIADNDRKKIFFIINQADDCDDEELEEAKSVNLNVLNNAGIKYENKIFCISAKQTMSEGKDSFEFNELMNTIRGFLADNKIKLQRTGFRNIVCNAVAGLANQLEVQADANKLSESELEDKIESLKKEYAHTKDILENGLKDFSSNWEDMISILEQQLPELENETKNRVHQYIQDIPMMNLTEKTVQVLPEKITEIIEAVLETPLASFQEQVDASLKKLDQHVRSIDKYLADSAIHVHSTSAINRHGGSIIASGTFIGVGSALTSLASVPAAWASIPYVGSIFATAGGIATLPLTALAAPLLLGGSLFLALPFFGWIKGKKRQKNEIMESANNSLTQTFCSMRTTKLPMLRLQGNNLVSKLEKTFTSRVEQTQQGLKQALAEKTHLIGCNETEKCESDLEYLSGILSVPEK